MTNNTHRNSEHNPHLGQLIQGGMESYVGLFIGIGEYANSKLGKVPYAVEDAQGVRDAFIRLGCFDDRLEIITNQQATHATLKTAIKNLCKSVQETDTIVLYYAGHGVKENGENYITCQDTNLHEVPSTALPLNGILAQLQECRSRRIIVFLDCCHSAIVFVDSMRSPLTHISYEQLKYDASRVEFLTIFSACKSDEKSLGDFERKHGVWSYYLIRALTGDAPGIYDGTLLFHDKLQEYLQRETSIRTRLISEKKAAQTPMLSGVYSGRHLVADIQKVFDQRSREATNIGIPVADAILIRREEDPIRKLPLFNSLRHTVPIAVSAASEKWIRVWAEPLLNSELATVVDLLIKAMGYKRAEMSAPTVHDGEATVSTVDFDYIISVEQSKANPSNFILTHTIANFKNSPILDDDRFNKAIGNKIEELRFTLPNITDVEAIIDQIQNLGIEEITVDYDPHDTTHCTITIKNIDDKIRLTETTLSILAFFRTTPKALVANFTKAMVAYLGQGGPKLLGNGE